MKHKTCVYENCDEQAKYNMLYEKIPKYCDKHRLELMVETPNQNINRAQPNDPNKLYCVNHK
jgi:hypothetical protein